MQQTQSRRLERQHRMAEAQLARDDREAQKLEKAQYLVDRQSEVDDLNDELADRLVALEGILAHTLVTDDRINFDDLRQLAPFHSFDPPNELNPGSAPRRIGVAPPSGLRRLMPGAAKRHISAVESAAADYRDAVSEFAHDEATKRAAFVVLKEEYEHTRALYNADARSRNAEIDNFQAAYFSKEPEAVVAYSEMVLTRSEYPEEGFAQKFRGAYRPESAELVIEYELPAAAIVPQEVEFRYIKTKDVIESKPRKATEVRQVYRDVIASIALRTLHELFEADQADALALITFNGIVDAHDPASGREVIVPVLSVRAPKVDFVELRLDKVDKVACLRSLGAQVSARPDELQAIKPIVEFNMVDRRFVEQGDALSGLESRPNLMDLTPTEFEVLVSNLFTKTGLDTKLTRSSRDGGVDAVAFDTRPILGGKVVIQAKRYRDAVGVSCKRLVRDNAQ